MNAQTLAWRFRHGSILVCTLIVGGTLQSKSIAVDFTEIARFNLDSTANSENAEFVGSNPSAMAWGSGRLYVAGFNNTGSAQNLAIVELLNATATGVIDTPTFSSPLGGAVGTLDSSVIENTPSFWGYTGLALNSDGSALLATFDLGSDDPQGIQVFNTSDGSQLWRVGVDFFDANNVRGSTGGAFDPGFGGTGELGVAAGFFGSGRRHLYDATTGAEIHGGGTSSSPGMIWTSGSGGFLPRDFDFDPATGDMYVRHNNRLTKAIRTGDNALSDQIVIVDPFNDLNDGTGNFFLGQNLSFMNTTEFGNLVIYNDRQSSGADQAFADVVKVVDTDGAEQAVNFALLGGDSIADGGALYDFQFDAATQTLAVLDFFNRNVHIFQIGALAPGNADFNEDGVVDGSDFLIWQRGFGIGTTFAEGDATGDGVVNGADLGVWENQFGTMPGSLTATVAVVPEPSSLCILLVLAGMWAQGSRRLQ